MRRVLLVAFHYPPFRGSSGVQRALKFARYLPDHGWEPLVLTAHPRAYPQVGDDQMGALRGVSVRRAFAVDAARHLAVRGHYPRWLALPDRWVSWCLGGVPAGLDMIQRFRPSLLWSTYPIATAHLLGLTLHRLSGVPWIADFRDPMTEGEYPADPMTRSVYRWIERQTIMRCSSAVFTAPGARRMYAARYPDAPQDRWTVVRNGYDEEDFANAERGLPRIAQPSGPIRLLHSGVLYRSERDPLAFFAALGDLRRAGRLSPVRLQVVLRGSGDVEYYRGQLRQHGLEDLVLLEPPLPHNDALAEMLQAGGLLVFQASNCNHQIPAKLFEYLRARRPILALTDPHGDTAAMLREAKTGRIARLDSKEDIVEELPEFVAEIREGRSPLASVEETRRHSREQRTGELAQLFDSMCKSPRR